MYIGVFKNIRIRKSDPKNPKSDPKVSEIPDIRSFGYPKFRISGFSDSDSDSHFMKFRISDIRNKYIFSITFM